MLRCKRLLGVAAFLFLLLTAFQVSGLRENFSLVFLQKRFAGNEATGVLIFIALFALGNLK